VVIASQLFLPTEDYDPVTDGPVWDVVYTDGKRVLTVQVVALDEETAVMRAGMKRAEMTKGDRWFFSMGNWPNWERVSAKVSD
jgi:hypothetical protein